MKLLETNDQIEKLDNNKSAILSLLDMAMSQKEKIYQSEIKSLHFKINTLTWAMAVIVLGFLAKLFLST
ncbi:MAG: hypothetical protein AAGA43_13490 [Bacteroidota bacterium]